MLALAVWFSLSLSPFYIPTAMQLPEVEAREIVLELLLFLEVYPGDNPKRPAVHVTSAGEGLLPISID